MSASSSNSFSLGYESSTTAGSGRSKEQKKPRVKGLPTRSQLAFPNQYNNNNNSNNNNSSSSSNMRAVPITRKLPPMEEGMFEEPNWVQRYKQMKENQKAAEAAGNRIKATNLQIKTNMIYPSFRNWEAGNRLKWPAKYAGRGSGMRKTRRLRRRFRKVTRKF